MSGVKVLSAYYVDRFKIFPWLVIPMLMSFLIEAQVGALSFYILISLLFYRLFDDIMMSSYDQIVKGKRNYHFHLNELKKMLWFPSCLYLLLTYQMFGVDGLAMSLVFMVLCLNLYRYFENSKIQYLSILSFYEPADTRSYIP